MSTIRIVLADSRAVADLETFAIRARRLDQRGMIRLTGFERGVVSYVAPLYPAGLGDHSPTVIGVRVTPALVSSELDTTQSLDTVIAALARLRENNGTELYLVDDDVRVPWAAITPPRFDWRPTAQFEARALEPVLEAGVAEVADGTPEGAGELAVHQLRSAVWSRPVAELANVPAGVALALDGLGFVQPGCTLTLFRSGVWFRVSAPLGDVIGRAGR